MTNYAVISEAIAKKLYNAEIRLESIEEVIDNHTQYAVNELERRYINGEDVGEALDEAYNNHERACAEREAREFIRDKYKEARDLYIKVCRLIELANDVEINGL